MNSEDDNMNQELLKLLKEIEEKNYEYKKENVTQPRYRLFFGDPITGREDAKLSSGPSYVNYIERSNECQLIYKDQKTQLQFPMYNAERIVKITTKRSNKRVVIWQHPNYSLGDITYKDYMSKEELRKIPIKDPLGNMDYRTEKKVVDIPFDKYVPERDKGYSKVRIIYIDGKEVHRLMGETDIEEKTYRLIKYIKGERDCI